MGIDVYSGLETFNVLGIEHHSAKVVEPKQKFDIGDFTVLPFDVQHDVPCLGYLIKHCDFGNLLFATDTYYLKYKFTGIHYMMVECNYSREILDKNTAEGRINNQRRIRTIKSHFSLENLIKFLKANDLSQLKEIHLLHLSDENSDEELFINEVQKASGVPVYVC